MWSERSKSFQVLKDLRGFLWMFNLFCLFVFTDLFHVVFVECFLLLFNGLDMVQISWDYDA